MDGIGLLLLLLLLYNNLVVNYNVLIIRFKMILSRGKPVVVVCNDYIGSVCHTRLIHCYVYIRNDRRLNWLNNFENEIKRTGALLFPGCWYVNYSLLFIRYNVCNYWIEGKIIMQLIWYVGSNKADRVILMRFRYFFSFLLCEIKILVEPDLG